MTPEEFVWWMDGYRQAITGSDLTPGDWKRVTEALDSACRHIHASRRKVITVPGGETSLEKWRELMEKYPSEYTVEKAE